MGRKVAFDITTAKRVIELYDEGQVNHFLKDGWVLLAAGFDIGDEGSTKCYILGTTSEKDPDDEFTQFIQELERT